MRNKIRFSDAELMAAIRGKENAEPAIWQLYADHSAVCRSYIMGKGATEEDADDIFQETVVSFIDSVQKDKFRQDSGIRTFLVSISRNLWYNEIRRRKRADSREKLYISDQEQEDAGIQDIIQDREMKKQMNELLQSLGDSCRKILELFYYENLSMKEMVSHLHYENEQVVRNKKYKCLQQLSEKIKQHTQTARQMNQLIKK
jgi:RNA polymerase sigma factor (sigma-70 family)